MRFRRPLYLFATLALQFVVAYGGSPFGEKNVIDSAGPSVTTVDVADLDGDGHDDVLVCSYNDRQVGWYRNGLCEGSGFEPLKTIVLSTAASPYYVSGEDMDRDGFVDILVGSYAFEELPFYIYYNDGTGQFSEVSIVNASVTSWDAGDMDGDGDMDVVAANYFFNEIVWFRNEGGRTFSKHTLGASVSMPVAVVLSDFDGDGMLDAAAKGWDIGEVVWYRNEGGGVFGGVQLISDRNNTYGTGLHLRDMNNDGILDLLVCSGTSTGWYQSFGNGSFNGQKEIQDGMSLNNVDAADVDGDGDMDVVGGTSTEVFSFENLGNGSYAVQQVDAQGANAVFLRDLDGDGRADFGALMDGSWWYNNLQGEPISPEAALGGVEWSPFAIWLPCTCWDILKPNWRVPYLKALFVAVSGMIPLIARRPQLHVAASRGGMPKTACGGK
ncbi:hypothetical protein CYMTET_34117 [Cymbomonas tetramitiformis]|uniref:FG-GAP repeat protein n=1 Tax=Cymbomonas tetramitiformis TaxID=36881 RepID=A0AAE0FBV3_9CHLO|nr:hypothetical protein CYMTET_34117 [Cymbomonas tetramitiformis]